MMTLQSAVIVAVFALVGVQSAQNPPCHWYSPYYEKIEMPCYNVVKNTTSYEIREFGTETFEAWTSAATQGPFDTAVQEGFQANFAYIEGANSEKTKIPMTSPVLARPLNTSDVAWNVSFFVPSSLYPTPSSIPTPTNGVDIVAVPRTGVTVAVVEFGGFANHKEFIQAETQLRANLKADGVSVVDPNSDMLFARVYAQLDSPFTLFNRHNEVWLRIA